MKILLAWIINALALFVVVKIVPGIEVEDTATLFLAALVIGVVNALIKPVLQIVSLPITLLTLGIFALIVNAALFGLAAWLVSGFSVSGFWSALFGALVMSVVGGILHSLTDPKKVY
ncbi:MAG: phage holin family protein [bacterium]|nr:phage holin family protein [bacterium]